MAGLFANPLAQRAFSYLMNKAGFDARKAINLVSQKMNDNQGHNTRDGIVYDFDRMQIVYQRS